MDDISLLFELSYVFCYTYATDFTFVRHFIDDEVIPNTSLPWKRSAFLKVIEMLKSDMSWRTSEQLVRFMQYIVAPSFTYAFEKYDTDDVCRSSALTSVQKPFRSSAVVPTRSRPTTRKASCGKCARM